MSPKSPPYACIEQRDKTDSPESPRDTMLTESFIGQW